MTNSIQICDNPGPETNESRITVCDENEPNESQVVICADPDVCPPGTPELSISGSETPGNGTVYTVSGGVGPFVWSASGGASMTPTGPRSAQINVDGTCGGGAVSASDVCGIANKMVRYPSGQWVSCGSVGRGDCTGGSRCYFDPVNGWGYYYEGHYRFGGSLRCCTEGDCGTTSGDTNGHDCLSLSSAVQADGKCETWECGGQTLKASASVYKWECP